MMDSEHKSAVISDDVHKLTAYHESGHTPCLFILMGAHSVHKATTVPHAMFIVVVTQLCKKDETCVSRKETLARLDVCMGGRVAEELIFGEDGVTSGASSESAATTSCSTEITIYTEVDVPAAELPPVLLMRC
ncbi:putative peptidase M41 [Helianthus debilis subsp. tardiflorus]